MPLPKDRIDKSEKLVEELNDLLTDAFTRSEDAIHAVLETARKLELLGWTRVSRWELK